jgi:hypothetical protein
MFGRVGPQRELADLLELIDRRPCREPWNPAMI